jgi:N-methylhydantoinase B
VRWDVIEGYVTPEAAAREYGVTVRYTGNPDALVKLPERWIIERIDRAITERDRA